MPIRVWREGDRELSEWHCGCVTSIDLKLPKNHPDKVRLWKCKKDSALDALEGSMDELGLGGWNISPVNRYRMKFTCLTCQKKGLDYDAADIHRNFGDKVIVE